MECQTVSAAHRSGQSLRDNRWERKEKKQFHSNTGMTPLQAIAEGTPLALHLEISATSWVLVMRTGQTVVPLPSGALWDTCTNAPPEEI